MKCGCCHLIAQLFTQGLSAVRCNDRDLSPSPFATLAPPPPPHPPHRQRHSNSGARVMSEVTARRGANFNCTPPIKIAPRSRRKVEYSDPGPSPANGQGTLHPPFSSCSYLKEWVSRATLWYPYRMRFPPQFQCRPEMICI